MLIDKVLLMAVYIVAYYTYKVGYAFFVFVVAPRLHLVRDLRKCGGRWALVTGGGRGYGYGYAAALARAGVNIVLLGAHRVELEHAAAALRCRFPKVRVCVLVLTPKPGDDPAAAARTLRVRVHRLLKQEAGEASHHSLTDIEVCDGLSQDDSRSCPADKSQHPEPRNDFIGQPLCGCHCESDDFQGEGQYVNDGPPAEPSEPLGNADRHDSPERTSPAAEMDSPRDTSGSPPVDAPRTKILDGIGIVVNAATLSADCAANFGKPFASCKPDPVTAASKVLAVNLNLMLLTTGAFLPHFVDQGRGVIINVAAGFAAANRPVYGFAAAGAARAAAAHLTEGIRQELRSAVLDRLGCKRCTCLRAPCSAAVEGGANGDDDPAALWKQHKVILQTVTPLQCLQLCCPPHPPAAATAGDPELYMRRFERFANSALKTVGYYDVTPGTGVAWCLAALLDFLVIFTPSKVAAYLTRVVALAAARADESYRVGARKRRKS